MKKLPLIAAGIALVLTLLGMLVNYLYFKQNQWLLLAHHIYGGEITVERGFGWKVSHIYAMTSTGRDSTSLKFSILNFILTFLILALIIWAVAAIVTKIKARRTF